MYIHQHQNIHFCSYHLLKQTNFRFQQKLLVLISFLSQKDLYFIEEIDSDQNLFQTLKFFSNFFFIFSFFYHPDICRLSCTLFLLQSCMSFVVNQQWLSHKFNQYIQKNRIYIYQTFQHQFQNFFASSIFHLFLIKVVTYVDVVWMRPSLFF